MPTLPLQQKYISQFSVLINAQPQGTLLLITSGDAHLNQQVFDVAAQLKSMIKPRSSLNNFGWESVTLDHF
ncbi:MAG TPA: hypothetical protein DCL66_04885 [Gammaproteobacteria bacterium]|nr:hypothetical protein [Gammaproteobacteria bacterium]